MDRPEVPPLEPRKKRKKPKRKKKPETKPVLPQTFWYTPGLERQKKRNLAVPQEPLSDAVKLKTWFCSMTPEQRRSVMSIVDPDLTYILVTFLLIIFLFSFSLLLFFSSIFLLAFFLLFFFRFVCMRRKELKKKVIFLKLGSMISSNLLHFQRETLRQDTGNKIKLSSFFSYQKKGKKLLNQPEAQLFVEKKKRILHTYLREEAWMIIL